jgi:hypothetical protein
MQTIQDDVHALFAASNTGPFMEAVLVPLQNRGPLRVTCDWLYSSLNCCPGDASAFPWLFYKVDATHVAMSPKYGCHNRTLYASVRDDIGWYLQVQAPYSADWIGAVGRDEMLTLELVDLLLARIKGFNGQYLALDDGISDHGGHQGYRVRSNGTSGDADAALWLLRVNRAVQDHVRFAYSAPLDAAALAGVLAPRGLQASAAALARALAVQSLSQ